MEKEKNNRESADTGEVTEKELLVDVQKLQKYLHDNLPKSIMCQ
ncbi:MAG: hypothetical protein ACYTDV_02930 [Planctomycetota bacterium]|jgi:hypothetical protein